jgi:hypothetical protein
MFYYLCGVRGDGGGVVVVIYVGGIKLITWVLLRFLLEVSFLLYRVRTQSCECGKEKPC